MQKIEPLAGCSFHPALRLHTRIEYGRGGVVFSKLALNSRPGSFAACDHEDVRARQGRHRLAQTGGRKRVERIHEHDIHLTVKTPVLKPVVQNEVLHGETFFEQTSDFRSIGADSDRR